MEVTNTYTREQLKECMEKIRELGYSWDLIHQASRYVMIEEMGMPEKQNVQLAKDVYTITTTLSDTPRGSSGERL